jgi:hypothetical protein
MKVAEWESGGVGVRGNAIKKAIVTFCITTAAFRLSGTIASGEPP